MTTTRVVAQQRADHEQHGTRRGSSALPDHEVTRHYPATVRWTGLWLLLTVVTVLGAGLIPLWFEPRFYFMGDTQAGAFGQWVHLGYQLRSGEWPLLNLQSWRAGNYIAEGQWGLFSPLTMAIALGASFTTQAVPYVTVLKLGLLVAAGVGTFLLTSSYRVPPPAAYVAGLAVTVGGFTQYFDSPSWVTGQMVWALLPLAWWALRRTSAHNASPFLPLVFGYLIVTVGYVYGTIYLAVVIVACLLDAGLARNRPGMVRVLLVGVCCALIAVAVYLPGILTADVTTRGGFLIVGSGRLQSDLPGLAAGMLPTVVSPASPDYPGHYIAWFLPLVTWVDRARARELWRSLAGLLLVLVIVVAWVLGPNQVGPIRWPARVMPIVVLAVVVLTVILLSRAMVRRLSRARLLAALLWTAGAGYLVGGRYWTSRHMTLVSMLVVMVGVLVVWLAWRWGHDRGRAVTVATVPVALFLAVWSVGVVGVQHHYRPEAPSAERHMPNDIAAYGSAAAKAVGDTMIIGDAQDAVIADPAVVRDFLIASSWFVPNRSVQSVYSTIGFSTYNKRYCFIYNGGTCRKALQTLFEEEPRTGRLRVDLLSISSLHIFRDGFKDKVLLDPPPGWRVADATEFGVTWVRREPVPTAGGVVWTSPDSAVTQSTSSPREVTFTVDRVPPEGGQVVLSRLAWPGYGVQGGDLVDPTDGYLTTVQIPGTAVGQTVTVRFSPPGWGVELVAWWAGALLASVWCLAAWVLRRPRSIARQDQPSASARVH